MSFPKYPEYKDSGVEWLGEVPAHWDVRRLKFVLSQITDRATERVNPVALENIEGWSGRYVEGESDYSGGGIAFQKGDILFGKLRPYLAKVYLPINHGEAVGDFHVMRPCRKLSERYAFHQLLQPQFISVVDGATHGAKMPRVGWEVMGNMPFVTPPLHEQAHIATFLDYETARIDALVEEQQRLIELLKEKRQAVISHAVTKGLDPDVPMKDSGVEWLGEMPAHWMVVRVKHIKASTQNAFVDGPFGSNLKSEHFVDDGDAYVIESGFATKGILDSEALKKITYEHFITISRSQVKGGDIVIAKIGARYGMCSILPDLDKLAVVSGNSLKLTVNLELCDPFFAVLVFRYLRERGAIEDIVNMTAQPALSLGEMSNLPFPLPDLEEQREIVKGASERIKKFDDMAGECEHLIALSQERRSALISAAVTGKIDVRGWQPPVGSTASSEATQTEMV